MKDYISINGISQDLSQTNFLKSKRTYTVNNRGTSKTVHRYFCKKYLESTLVNGEIIKRNFFLYSISKGCTYCYPCALFGSKSSFATCGFSNWKKAEEKLSSHKNSHKHRINISTMKQRSIILERIDQQLIHQMEFENNYWKTILKRIVAVVKALSSRGLSFRGETTQIGCSNNGNFLMAIELIAEFDVVLSEHIKKYGNPGKGHTSYFSFHTYEQLILLMADNVVNNIIQEVNEACYFSISIDSTPDISHTDQLSFIGL